jgi:tetratricopeptide (TPR) repeat protein
VLESCAQRINYGGRTSLAIRFADRALEICAELRLPEPLRAIDLRGDARCARGDIGGLDDLRHALELARSREAGHWVCVVASNLGECLNVFEGPAAALGVHRQGLELARQRRDELAICFCRSVLFVDLVWAGRWDEALAEADDLERCLEERKDRWDLVLVRATCALLGAWRGNSAAAAEKAAWAEKSSRETPIVATRVACLISLAAVEAGLGNEDAALLLLDTCASLLNDAEGTDVGCALRIPEAIRLAIGLGLPELAQRLVNELPADRPFDQGTLITLDAQLCQRRGDHDGAAARFSGAEAQWARLGIPYERAHAVLGRGRSLAALGRTAEAAAALASAQKAFIALGAMPALAETAALLRALAE